MISNSIYQELLSFLPKEKILIDEPMKKHTTFRIGGNCDFFINVTEIDELKKILDLAKKECVPITVIGNGSNVLVKDTGIRGITLNLNFKKISKKEEKNNIIYTCGCGVTLSNIANIALEDEATGFEFAYGIPGSLGGAIYMNAGAYGGEVKDVLIETIYIDKDGNTKTIDNIGHKFGYRSSVFQSNNGIIIESKILLQKGNKDEIKKKMQENIQARQEKQPIEYPSAGSVFKRGENFIAAKLIDECGLKGTKVGDAEVSTKHAGFIINKGNATAQDVIELINYIATTVKEKTGYEIQNEIKIIGD